MNRYLTLAILIALSGLLSSPTWAQSEEEGEFYASPMLTFAYVTQEVFKPKCYQCHSSSARRLRGGLNLENYNTVYAKRAKIRTMALVRKVMPPRKAGGPLNAREMMILDNWLKAGAPMSLYEEYLE